MAKTRTRIPQQQKVRRDSRQTALILELRRSNASGFHPSGSQYKRKPKHSGRGWDEAH